VLVLCAIAAVGCRRDREPNKILDGYITGTTEVIPPAQAAQQYTLLQRDMLRVVIPVIHKLERTDSSFGELTGPVGSKYSFNTTEKHYGNAAFTIEFKDDFGATIDPITTRTSTTTLKSVIVTGTAHSPAFDPINETMTLVLASSGVASSTIRMTGNATFTGSSYSLTFTIDSAGNNAIFEGLTDGTVTASGTGGTPPATASLTFGYSTDRTANGQITWEGREGGLHIEPNGSGFVAESTGRILLE
jgi:hypothetical protein